MAALSYPIPGAALSDGYGPRDPIATAGGTSGGYHYGQDFAAAANTPILAAAPGRVIAAGWVGTYGNAVYIDHGDGLVTRYAHMIATPPVIVGQHVERERIGFVGSTGASTGPHLHFEVVKDGARVDPLPYLTEPVNAPTGQEAEEEPMNLRQMHYIENGKTYRASFVPGTPYFVPWTGGGEYANPIATEWETNSSVLVTKSLYGAFQRAAAAMLPADRIAVEMVNADE